VIECDGASIALDAEVARAISVWLDTGKAFAGESESPGPTRGRRRRGLRP
jgi:hypothetical protein